MKLDADWLNAPATRAAMAALDAARPGASRFVGGCVRNSLLLRPVDDIDIATQLLPEQVMAAASKAGLHAHPTGIAHGTVTIVASGTPFEVTTLRRDVSTDGRRATVAFTESWEEDAARRDFHLNALYCEADGALHDPTGRGLADAAAGRIAFIGAAEDRVREDYLRILRFFRFSAWYATPPYDETGLKACAALKDGMAGLSAERVWKEFKKLLSAPTPSPAVQAMLSTGVMAFVAPEGSDLKRLARVMEADPLLRLAALLPNETGPAQALARRLKLSNDEKARLARACTRIPELSLEMRRAQVRQVLYRRGGAHVRDRAALRYAETDDPRWKAIMREADAWRHPRLPVDGADAKALGVSEGPELGRVLKAVEDWWADADFPDDRAEALAKLREAAGRG